MTDYQALLDSQPRVPSQWANLYGGAAPTGGGGNLMTAMPEYQAWAANPTPETLAAFQAAQAKQSQNAGPIPGYTFKEDPNLSLSNPYTGGKVTGLGQFIDAQGNPYRDASGNPYLLNAAGQDVGWWNQNAQNFSKEDKLNRSFFTNPQNWAPLAIAGASLAALAGGAGAAGAAAGEGGGGGAGVTSGLETFAGTPATAVAGESTWLPEAGGAAEGLGGAGDALAAEAGVAPGTALTSALPAAGDVAEFGVGPGVASNSGWLGALKGSVMNPDGSVNWSQALKTFGSMTNPNQKDQSGGTLGNLAGIFTNSQGAPAWGKIAIGGLGALAGLYANSKANKQAAPVPLPASLSKPLTPLTLQRTVNKPTGRDLLHYGESPEGEFQFFNDQYVPKAGGGDVRGPGSGRDDKIDALLSDGEYVMDAETVAMLGDGSLDEGARRLDQMRANLRKHKGQALAKGKFSPDAKAPEQYLPGGAPKAKGGPIRPDLLMRSLTAPTAVRNSRSAALRGLPLPPNNLDRLATVLDKSQPLDLSKLSPEDLESYRSWLLGILNTPPQKARGGPIDLHVIPGGLPKLTLEERAMKLDQVQRMIDAYKQAQDAAAQEKKRLGITEGTDPYNQQPRPPLKLVQARGGLVEAQARVKAIQSKLKKAEGGPVKELTKFADKLEESLEHGDTDLAVGE
jgi:hypothetical protein